jgi:hypothetical protein
MFNLCVECVNVTFQNEHIIINRYMSQLTCEPGNASKRNILVPLSFRYLWCGSVSCYIYVKTSTQLSLMTNMSVVKQYPICSYA